MYFKSRAWRGVDVECTNIYIYIYIYIYIVEGNIHRIIMKEK
jgi:hypothetical protein